MCISGLVLGWSQTAFGQLDTLTVAGAPRWTVFVDGVEQKGHGDGPLLDSLDTIVARHLQQLTREGYPFARLDSVRLDTTEHIAKGRLYLGRGEAVRVRSVELHGAVALDSFDLLAGMETRPGRSFSPVRLEADIDWILRRYEAAGYPLAEIRVEQADFFHTASPAVEVRLRILEGSQVSLKRIELPGAHRTKARYAARISGLALGAPLVDYDPEQIQLRLLETGLFRSVDLPRLRIEPDSGAVVVIPVEEESPGLFDLVLGFQPPAGAGSGRLVGNGHLALRNILGEGRSASLKLSRLPGQISSVQAFASDPFLAGSRLGIEVRFEGLQDSTLYGKQRYAGALTYRLSREWEAVMSLSRERTRPGQEGIRLVQGQQRIPRAHAWFGGLGLRYQRLDQPQNPRRGLLFDLSFERGTKDRQLRVQTIAGDTLVERSRVRQDRFSGAARVYVPTLPRQVLVLGADARLLGSDTYDTSDLFRFGGASTLRGYDEDRFLGRLVGRSLVEYRYLLDRLSYVLAFLDLGYVETPATAGGSVVRGTYPGFGVGIQYDTPIGLVNTSYAMNREGGRTSGRVHVGVSFGL